MVKPPYCAYRHFNLSPIAVILYMRCTSRRTVGLLPTTLSDTLEGGLIRSLPTSHRPRSQLPTVYESLSTRSSHAPTGTIAPAALISPGCRLGSKGMPAPENRVRTVY